MVIPWLLPIPVVLKALLFLPVAAAAVHYIRRDALLSLPVSPARLDLNGQAELQLTCRNGETVDVKVLESSFIAAYLTVLNLRSLDEGKRITLILLPDNVEPESFRQLRVWLRWGAARQQSAENYSGDTAG
ncbi:hypothetical protein MTYP_02694 [Methylophilaceae bacterium]|nr:hypothetical protein MTYP_02694 [Methylophilaceae bacterium]